MKKIQPIISFKDYSDIELTKSQSVEKAILRSWDLLDDEKNPQFFFYFEVTEGPHLKYRFHSENTFYLRRSFDNQLYGLIANLLGRAPNLNEEINLNELIGKECLVSFQEHKNKKLEIFHLSPL